jgi:hypothetical protein
MQKQQESPPSDDSKRLNFWLCVAVLILWGFFPFYIHTQKHSQGETGELMVCSPEIFSLQEKMTPHTGAAIKRFSVSGAKSEHVFHPIIVAAAKRYRLEPALVKAIIFAESGYNPKATSKRGAQGLMQLMPKTAKALGVKNSYNPAENITGGVKYFRRLVDKFNGNIKLALAAYNSGSKNVRKYQGVPPFKETRNYIRKVFKYYKHYKKETAGPSKPV